LIHFKVCRAEMLPFSWLCNRWSKRNKSKK